MSIFPDWYLNNSIDHFDNSFSFLALICLNGFTTNKEMYVLAWGALLAAQGCLNIRFLFLKRNIIID